MFIFHSTKEFKIFDFFLEWFTKFGQRDFFFSQAKRQRRVELDPSLFHACTIFLISLYSPFIRA